MLEDEAAVEVIDDVTRRSRAGECDIDGGQQCHCDVRGGRRRTPHYRGHEDGGSDEPSGDGEEEDAWRQRVDGGVTIGFIGHPNVGKTSLLNAIVGRKVASVSRTPGHTKHLQTWQLTPLITICDSPGLVFPVAAATSNDVGDEDVSAGSRWARQMHDGRRRLAARRLRVLQAFPIAQVREPYSAIRLLALGIDLSHVQHRAARPTG